jgi:uncharacterized DUF497 family protein
LRQICTKSARKALVAIVYIICNNDWVEVEWDDRKNRVNFLKHQVWFEEAVSVIEHALTYDFMDPDHPDRTICRGYSKQQRLLVVVYLEKESLYRIISARKATVRERREYQEGI